jgi:hypothetical protein
VLMIWQNRLCEIIFSYLDSWSPASPKVFIVV